MSVSANTRRVVHSGCFAGPTRSASVPVKAPDVSSASSPETITGEAGIDAGPVSCARKIPVIATPPHNARVRTFPFIRTSKLIRNSLRWSLVRGLKSGQFTARSARDRNLEQAIRMCSHWRRKRMFYPRNPPLARSNLISGLTPATYSVAEGRNCPEALCWEN